MATMKELEAKLTLKQKQAALLLVQSEMNTEEKVTQDDIADQLGMTRQGLYKWRTQNKAFIEYKNLLADDILSSMRPMVYKQLMGLITGSQPSVKAIDLFMRRFALLTDKTQTEEIGGGEGARSNEQLEKSLDEIDDLINS